MKTFKKIKNLRTQSIRLSVYGMLILMFFILSCQQQDIEPVLTDDVSALDIRQSTDITTKIAHLRQVSKDGPIYLSGSQNYYTYAVKMKEVLQDGDLACDATLEFMDGQNIQLTLIEYIPYPPYEREAIMAGKMTPSGQIKFSLSPPITDIIEMHSGCIIYGGPGVNQGMLMYNGYFDGERLLASAPFYTKCETNFIPPIHPVEGPVHWSWTIDVTVD